MTESFKINYNCLFDMRRFPFEHQSCEFVMKLKALDNETVAFVESSPAVVYRGPTVLNEYEVEGWGTSTNTTADGGPVFVFSLKICRLYFIQLTTTFAQTFLLWMLGYITLHFDVRNFGDRIMASITILVVMAALLGSLKEDLPQTSYFKFIDLWFMWHIINIFIIFAYHVVLDKIMMVNGKFGEKVNFVAKAYLFPLLIILFYVMPIFRAN